MLVDRRFPSSPFTEGICIPCAPGFAVVSVPVPSFRWPKLCFLSPHGLESRVCHSVWNMYQDWEPVETNSSVLFPSYLRVGSVGSYVTVVFSLSFQACPGPQERRNASPAPGQPHTPHRKAALTHSFFLILSSYDGPFFLLDSFLCKRMFVVYEPAFLSLLF